MFLFRLVLFVCLVRSVQILCGSEFRWQYWPVSFRWSSLASSSFSFLLLPSPDSACAGAGAAPRLEACFETDRGVVSSPLVLNDKAVSRLRSSSFFHAMTAWRR